MARLQANDMVLALAAEIGLGPSAAHVAYVHFSALDERTGILVYLADVNNFGEFEQVIVSTDFNAFRAPNVNVYECVRATKNDCEENLLQRSQDCLRPTGDKPVSAPLRHSANCDSNSARRLHRRQSRLHCCDSARLAFYQSLFRHTNWHELADAGLHQSAYVDGRSIKCERFFEKVFNRA